MMCGEAQGWGGRACKLPDDVMPQGILGTTQKPQRLCSYLHQSSHYYSFRLSEKLGETQTVSKSLSERLQFAAATAQPPVTTQPLRNWVEHKHNHRGD